MRISDWSSDVCSSDLCASSADASMKYTLRPPKALESDWAISDKRGSVSAIRSEEHTSELQSLMRISYAVFCLKKKKKAEQLLKEKNITDEPYNKYQIQSKYKRV